MKLNTLQEQLENALSLEDMQKLDRTVRNVRNLVMKDIVDLLESGKAIETDLLPNKEKQLAELNEFQVSVNNKFNVIYKNGR